MSFSQPDSERVGSLVSTHVHHTPECKTLFTHVPASIKSLRTSLPGELRLAPRAPSPGWKAL